MTKGLGITSCSSTGSARTACTFPPAGPRRTAASSVSIWLAFPDAASSTASIVAIANPSRNAEPLRNRAHELAKADALHLARHLDVREHLTQRRMSQERREHRRERRLVAHLRAGGHLELALAHAGRDAHERVRDLLPGRRRMHLRSLGRGRTGLELFRNGLQPVVTEGDPRARIP